MEGIVLTYNNSGNGQLRDLASQQIIAFRRQYGLQTGSRVSYTGDPMHPRWALTVRLVEIRRQTISV